MVTVTPDLVRDRVKPASTDIEDAKVTDFIKDAEAAIEEETGVSINYPDCSQAKVVAIKNLAAIYRLVHISGGAAILLTALFHLLVPRTFLERLSYAVLAIMSLVQLYDLINAQTNHK